jgi:integrase
MLKALIDGGASPSYVSKGLLMALKRLTSWAVEVDPGQFDGLPVLVDALRGMKGPEVTRRKTRVQDPATSRRFLWWLWRRAVKAGGINGRFGKITTIMVWALRETGARPKDLCAAEWSEYTVRPDGWGLIVLPPWKQKTGRKTGKERRIAIPPDIAGRIEWIRSLEGRHEAHIFTHRRGRGRGAIGTAEAGEPWVKIDYERQRVHDTKTLQKWFYRVVIEARAAGVPLTDGFRLYWQRSAYATEGRRKGVPDAMLAEAMGTSVTMLDRNYTDLGVEDVMDAAKRARG